MDSIDLLHQHLPDPDAPVEEAVGVMGEFVTASKVKYLGLSNADVDTVRRAHAVRPISVPQSEYSIFARGNEELLDDLEELGTGFVAYPPLARGFLSGAVNPRDSYREEGSHRTIPWWAPGNFAANLEIVDRLTSLAESRGTRLPQLALAWLLARGDNIMPSPVPATENLSHTTSSPPNSRCLTPA